MEKHRRNDFIEQPKNNIKTKTIFFYKRHHNQSLKNDNLGKNICNISQMVNIPI